VSDFEVMSMADRKELEQLRAMYKQASLVWATLDAHTGMHEIAVRDLCEMVAQMKMQEATK